MDASILHYSKDIGEIVGIVGEYAGRLRLQHNFVGGGDQLLMGNSTEKLECEEMGTGLHVCFDFIDDARGNLPLHVNNIAGLVVVGWELALQRHRDSIVFVGPIIMMRSVVADWNQVGDGGSEDDGIKVGCHLYHLGTVVVEAFVIDGADMFASEF